MKHKLMTQAVLLDGQMYFAKSKWAFGLYLWITILCSKSRRYKENLNEMF